MEKNDLEQLLLGDTGSIPDSDNQDFTEILQQLQSNNSRYPQQQQQQTTQTQSQPQQMTQPQQRPIHPQPQIRTSLQPNIQVQRLQNPVQVGNMKQKPTTGKEHLQSSTNSAGMQMRLSQNIGQVPTNVPSATAMTSLSSTSSNIARTPAFSQTGASQTVPKQQQVYGRSISIPPQQQQQQQQQSQTLHAQARQGQLNQQSLLQQRILLKALPQIWSEFYKEHIPDSKKPLVQEVMKQLREKQKTKDDVNRVFIEIAGKEKYDLFYKQKLQQLFTKYQNQYQQQQSFLSNIKAPISQPRTAQSQAPSMPKLTPSMQTQKQIPPQPAPTTIQRPEAQPSAKRQKTKAQKTTISSTPPMTASEMMKKREEQKIQGIVSMKGISGVTSLAGINQQKEKMKTRPPELIEARIKEEKPRPMLNMPVFRKKVSEIAEKNNLKEISEDFYEKLSVATQEYLRSILQKLIQIAEARAEIPNKELEVQVTSSPRQMLGLPKRKRDEDLDKDRQKVAQLHEKFKSSANQEKEEYRKLVTLPSTKVVTLRDATYNQEAIPKRALLRYEARNAN